MAFDFQQKGFYLEMFAYEWMRKTGHRVRKSSVSNLWARTDEGRKNTRNVENLDGIPRKIEVLENRQGRCIRSRTGTRV
jgi:hypothetical protein